MRKVKKNVVFKRKTGENGENFAEIYIRFCGNLYTLCGNLYTLLRETGYGVGRKGSPAHETEDMEESGQRSGTDNAKRTNSWTEKAKTDLT